MFHSARGSTRTPPRSAPSSPRFGVDSESLAGSRRLSDLAEPAAAPGLSQVPSPPAALARFKDDVGSTGFTLAELLAQPEDVRLGTDLAIVRP